MCRSRLGSCGSLLASLAACARPSPTGSRRGAPNLPTEHVTPAVPPARLAALLERLLGAEIGAKFRSVEHEALRPAMDIYTLHRFLLQQGFQCEIVPNGVTRETRASPLSQPSWRPRRRQRGGKHSSPAQPTSGSICGTLATLSPFSLTLQKSRPPLRGGLGSASSKLTGSPDCPADPSSPFRPSRRMILCTPSFATPAADVWPKRRRRKRKSGRPCLLTRLRRRLPPLPTSLLRPRSLFPDTALWRRSLRRCNMWHLSGPTGAGSAGGSRLLFRPPL